MSQTARLFTLPDGGAARLRTVLDDAGFTGEGIAQMVGGDLIGFGRRMAPILMRRTARPGPLPTLIRLFLGLVPVPAAAAREALDPVPLEDLIAARFLEEAGGDTVRSCVHMRHFENLVIAVDPEWILTERPVSADHVMSISKSTLFLAQITDRLAAESALDIGTGHGLHALIAARHCDRVVATDLTDRAVAITRFNAEFNGVPSIDVRQGDLFEPVAQETFDLIVSNPPFIIAPPMDVHFLSAGLEVDDVIARLARETPRHLRPGGRAHFLANWALPADRPWEERVAPWFEGSGCDVTVLTFTTYPIDEYAARWIPPDVADPGLYRKTFDGWMRWYEERHIDGLAFGLVTMRRRDGDGESLRLSTPPLVFNEIDGNSLQVALALGRWVAEVDDDEFLRTRLRIVDGARVMHEYALREGEWTLTDAVLGVEKGFAEVAQIDVHGERLAARCDGTRTVAEVVGEMAGELGRPFDEVARRVLPAVRNLVERGVLLPEDD
jgi:methylase of polypeptide subunit release factors